MQSNMIINPLLAQKGKKIIKMMEKSSLYKNQTKYIKSFRTTFETFLKTNKIDRSSDEVKKFMDENYNRRERFNKFIHKVLKNLDLYFSREKDHQKIYFGDELVSETVKVKNFLKETVFENRTKQICTVCNEITTKDCVYFRGMPVCAECQQILGITKEGHQVDFLKRGDLIKNCGKFHKTYNCKECGTHVVGTRTTTCKDKLCAHCAHTRAQKKKNKIRAIVEEYLDTGMKSGYRIIPRKEYLRFTLKYKKTEHGKVLSFPKIFSKKNQHSPKTKLPEIKIGKHLPKNNSKKRFNGAFNLFDKIKNHKIKNIKSLKLMIRGSSREICSMEEPYYETTQIKIKEYKYPLKFLTLTIKNVKPGRLLLGIMKLRDSWKKLKRRRIMKSMFAGYYSIEVTYNPVESSWHPHMHCLIVSDYIPRDKISQAWLEITGDSWDVDIRAIKNFDTNKIHKNKNETSINNALNEVVKYMAKLTLTKDGQLPPEFQNELRLMELITALRSTRQVQGFGDFYGSESIINLAVDKEMELQERREQDREKLIDFILEMQKRKNISDLVIETMIAGIEKFYENEEKALPDCPRCGAHNYKYSGIVHEKDIPKLEASNKLIMKHFAGLVPKNKREQSGGCVYG